MQEGTARKKKKKRDTFWLLDLRFSLFGGAHRWGSNLNNMIFLEGVSLVIAETESTINAGNRQNKHSSNPEMVALIFCQFLDENYQHSNRRKTSSK